MVKYVSEQQLLQGQVLFAAKDATEPLGITGPVSSIERDRIENDVGRLWVYEIYEISKRFDRNLQDSHPQMTQRSH
jgi:hypothetical protein